jgi:hypothetical protein
VTVLTGHTGPDSAYLVDDYPYGRVLRCQIRYWVDTRATGKSKGDQRFVSQTTNPKRPGTVWNAPKPSTYSAIVAMYLDHNQHVKAHHIHFWIEGAADVRARHTGVYDGLTEDQRARYDLLLKLSRRANPTTWREWDERVTALAEYIAATGEAPTLVSNVWTYEGRPYYLSDPAAYVTAARDLKGAQ